MIVTRYLFISIPDLVAIPDYITGAEENWGLIGFTSPMILFDPEKTSDDLHQAVCVTVTHELAHQVSVCVTVIHELVHQVSVCARCVTGNT